MKLRAKHWVRFHGVWYKAGQIVEAESNKGLERYFDVVEEPKPRRKKS